MLPNNVRLVQQGLTIKLKWPRDYRDGHILVALYATLGRYETECEMVKRIVEMFNRGQDERETRAQLGD